jgi:hypothetical protein
MAQQEGTDIDAIRRRLVKAESERDTLRTAGLQEQYLAAYFEVEALELKLNCALRDKTGVQMPLFMDTEATWVLLDRAGTP